VKKTQRQQCRYPKLLCKAALATKLENTSFPNRVRNRRLFVLLFKMDSRKMENPWRIVKTAKINSLLATTTLNYSVMH